MRRPTLAGGACVIALGLAAMMLFLLPATGAALTPGAGGEGKGGEEGKPGPEANGCACGEVVRRVLESPCPACMAKINGAVQEGRLDEALASPHRLVLQVVLDLVPERSRCLDHRMELVASIADVHENMDRLLSKEVMIRAHYMGWSGDVGPEAGVPVTRSDWLLKDENGWIYVTGGAIPGLSPWRKGDQGKEVEVVGVVEAKPDGRPCLGFKDGRVLAKKELAGADPPIA